MPIDGKDTYYTQAAAEGLVLGSYQFNEFKTMDEDPFEMMGATVVSGNKQAVAKGTIIANGVCLARDVEKPPREMWLHQPTSQKMLKLSAKPGA